MVSSRTTIRRAGLADLRAVRDPHCRVGGWSRARDDESGRAASWGIENDGFTRPVGLTIDTVSGGEVATITGDPQTTALPCAGYDLRAAWRAVALVQLLGAVAAQTALTGIFG